MIDYPTAPQSPKTSRRAALLAWLKQHRKPLLLWLRLVIAVGLMAFVITLVSQDEDQLRHVDWTLVPIAWGMMLVATVVKSLRWSLLVRQSRMDLSFRRLVGTYLVGAFFSTVLPTSVGGDAVRAVDTAARTGRTADSTSSVLIERGFGLLAVIGSGSLFALFLPAGKVPLTFVLAVHAMFITGIIGIVLLRQGWFIEPLVRLMIRFRLAKYVDKMRSLQRAFSGHLGSPRVMAAMLGLSLIANALTMGAIYLVLTAVTRPIAAVAFVPMIALATTAELIPISISALGVKESAYVFFLGLAGVPNIDAGVIAIIVRVLSWGLALLGGIVFLGRTLRARPAPAEVPSGR